MYKSKDRETKTLFKELLPFGGQLDESNRWFKRKQRERNRLEGGIGHGKEHFELDRIRYEGRDGSEMWVRLGVMGMNLKAAMKKA